MREVKLVMIVTMMEIVTIRILQTGTNTLLDRSKYFIAKFLGDQLIALEDEPLLKGRSSVNFTIEVVYCISTSLRFLKLLLVNR